MADAKGFCLLIVVGVGLGPQPGGPPARVVLGSCPGGSHLRMQVLFLF